MIINVTPNVRQIHVEEVIAVLHKFEKVCDVHYETFVTETKDPYTEGFFIQIVGNTIHFDDLVLLAQLIERFLEIPQCNIIMH